MGLQQLVVLNGDAAVVGVITRTDLIAETGKEFLKQMFEPQSQTNEIPHGLSFVLYYYYYYY